MAEEELTLMVRAAMNDLEETGIHWLPDGYARAICEAVQMLWPERNIIALEPPPYDEWVIFDQDKAEVPFDQLPALAHARKSARDQIE